MCSNAEAVQAVESKIQIPTYSILHAVCRKCEINKANIVLRKTDPYCWDCFLKQAVHKFRSTLGKHQAVRSNEKVLLAYSGGLSSGTMVQIIKQMQKDVTVEECENKKIMYLRPALLHIDECVVANVPDEERFENLASIQKLADSCNVDVYFCSLSYSLARNFREIELVSNKNCPIQSTVFDEHLKDLLQSAKNLTAKEELVLRLKQRLIVSAAKKLGYQKVFLGTTASRLAGQLLAAVATGRGEQLADEIGFSDRRGGVDIMRPMREFHDPEIGYMAHYFQIQSLSFPNLLSKFQAPSSIGELTTDFAVRLQKDFPGTISTLFRIGDKIKSVVNVTQESKTFTCLMCYSKTEVASTNGACVARAVSELVSTSSQSGNIFANPTICINGDLALPNKDRSAPTTLPYSDVPLCYGCRVTVQQIGKVELMSHFFKDDILEEVACPNENDQ